MASARRDPVCLIFLLDIMTASIHGYPDIPTTMCTLDKGTQRHFSMSLSQELLLVSLPEISAKLKN